MKPLVAKSDAELGSRAGYISVWLAARGLGLPPGMWLSALEQVHEYAGQIVIPGRRSNETAEEEALPDSFSKWMRRYLEAAEGDKNWPKRFLRHRSVIERLRNIDLYIQIMANRPKQPQSATDFYTDHIESQNCPSSAQR